MRLKISLIATAMMLMCCLSQARADLVITEAMSSSGTGGTPDWFELTNTGPGAVDLTGFKMDDGSFAFATAQTLEGVTSIAANERVLFLIREAAQSTATLAADFKTFWGGIASVQVGSYLDSGTGFGSGGDGLVVFNAAGVEVTPRANFGAATTGVSFRYNLDGSANGLSVAGELGAFVSANALGNIGSPGVVPEPSTFALAGMALVAVAVYGRRKSRNV